MEAEFSGKMVFTACTGEDDPLGAIATALKKFCANGSARPKRAGKGRGLALNAPLKR